MRILTLTIILALAVPLMALGQREPQETQGQAKEPQTTEPSKGKKKAHSAHEHGTKPETSTATSGQSEVKGGTQDASRTQTGSRSSTSQTTTVNKQEFKSRHSEVFNLGRHPKEFFVQRYGASHFRLIGSTYFVFVDNCWVAVDVEGFVYTERIICPGDPDYIVID
jgi:hypothetical protein